jgi:Na+-driven multidrug efflux pump
MYRMREEVLAVKIHKHRALKSRAGVPPPQAAAAATEVNPNTPTAPWPTASMLFRFALPTLILPLADPVMSLIDTVCIGNCGTTLELAALGPASLLFSCASSLFSALTATTLSEISTLLARGDSAGAAASFGEALQVAAVAGVVVMGVYGLLSVQMIKLLGVTADVVPTAAGYLAMRSLAAPAAKGTAICAVRPPIHLASSNMKFNRSDND